MTLLATLLELGLRVRLDTLLVLGLRCLEPLIWPARAASAVEDRLLAPTGGFKSSPSITAESFFPEDVDIDLLLADVGVSDFFLACTLLAGEYLPSAPPPPCPPSVREKDLLNGLVVVTSTNEKESLLTERSIELFGSRTLCAIPWLSTVLPPF